MGRYTPRQLGRGVDGRSMRCTGCDPGSRSDEELGNHSEEERTFSWIERRKKTDIPG